MRSLIAAVASTALLLATFPATAAEHGGQHAGLPEHVQHAIGEAHDHIENAEGLSEADKARYHDIVDKVASEKASVAAAAERIVTLATSSATAEQRDEIETKVREELAAIQGSHATFASIQRKLYDEIKDSPDISAETKAEVESLLQKVEDGSLSPADALAAVKSNVALASSSEGYGGAFVLILVLFILLVIVGAGFG